MPRSYIVTTSTALNTLHRRSEGGFCEQRHHHRVDFRRVRRGDAVPVTYYTCAPRAPYPRKYATIKDKILYRVEAYGAMSSAHLVSDVGHWHWRSTSRATPAHTIRARISELVASGDLIRLIDARYAHDEALRQSEREMRRIRRAMGV